MRDAEIVSEWDQREAELLEVTRAMWEAAGRIVTATMSLGQPFYEAYRHSTSDAGRFAVTAQWALAVEASGA